jgi:hypothetical protein
MEGGHGFEKFTYGADDLLHIPGKDDEIHHAMRI